MWNFNLTYYRMAGEGARAMTAVAESTRGPVGLGGWLVLPIITLVHCIAITLLWTVPELPVLFSARYWSEAGVPVATFASILAAFDLATVPLAIYALALMFGKARELPLVMIVFYVTLSVLEAARLAFPLFLWDTVPAFEFSGTGYFVLETLFRPIVWIPYFLVSKRVRNTFVN